MDDDADARAARAWLVEHVAYGDGAIGDDVASLAAFRRAAAAEALEYAAESIVRSHPDEPLTLDDIDSHRGRLVLVAKWLRSCAQARRAG